jgi:D-sedoheptulose 7-phosphate isomerase
MKEIETIIDESSLIIQSIKNHTEDIQKTASSIISCFKDGKKILLCGNGGSAADAQHIAAEFVSRFEKERDSLPAIALSTDTSCITSIGNDYSFDSIFSRQCESLVNSGDIVIGISTSGNSNNIKNAFEVGKQKGAITIGLLGNNGGKIKNISDISIIINSKSTARIQEAHRTIYHIICYLVEKEFEKN